MYTAEEFDKLKTKILKYVMYKKRTEQEIRRKFSEEDAEMLEDAIEHLKEIGYINDQNYIERAVAEYINLNNLSIKELKYKLQAKGIQSDTIEDYIYNNSDKLEEYEINSAKNIIIKKQNAMEEQQLIQFLLKKGYKLDSIKEAIRNEE